MMDEQQQSIATSFGTRMKIARESLHLSEKDAAARLHLNPKIIHILEDEDFKNAPPATFMRGYFRSYARLLNFGEQDINIALIQSGLDVKNNAPIKPMSNMGTIYKNDTNMRWLTYLVVSVLVILVGIWWNSHSRYSVSDVLTRTITQQTPQQAAVNQTQPAPIPTAPSTTNANAATIPSNAPTITQQQPVIGSTPPQPAPLTNDLPVVIPNTLLPSVTSPATTMVPTIEQQKALSTTQTPDNKPATETKPSSEHSSHMIMALPEPGLESN